MAEGKKSFLLYADYIHTFEHLSDEEAGKLVKFLFQYVNDQNPVIEDRILKIAFEPIKRQLKRDLNDWESEREKRSDNAALGNLKKYRSDLYDKVKANTISLDEAISIAYGRTRSSTTEHDRTGSDTVRMLTDSDTVTDNVNGIVNDKYLVPEMFSVFKKYLPNYPGMIDKDFKPLKSISDFILTQLGLKGDIIKNQKIIVAEWNKLCAVIAEDKFYKKKTLSTISNQIQEIFQLSKEDGSDKINGRNSKSGSGKYQPKGQGGY